MDPQARNHILKAAIQVFSEKGYDGARMAEIARKAKVNQAMLHYYFNAKENLYEQVLLHLFGLEQRAEVIKQLDKYDLSPSQNLYLCIYYLVHLHLNPKNAVIERFLFSQMGKGGIKRIITIAKKFFLPQIQFLIKVLELGTESGDFECVDTSLAATEIVLFIVTYENFRWHFSDTDMYEHYYGKDHKEKVFDFMIKHTFKSFCPSGRTVEIPVVPDNLIKELDETIKKIIHAMQGGVND